MRPVRDSMERRLSEARCVCGKGPLSAGSATFGSVLSSQLDLFTHFPINKDRE